MKKITCKTHPKMSVIVELLFVKYCINIDIFYNINKLNILL